MKAIAITVLLMNGSPGAMSHVDDVMPMEKCQQLKKVIESGDPVQQQINGQTVQRTIMICQPLGQPDIDQLVKQLKE